MAWKKMGLVFRLQDHNIPWIKSHALMPTPLLLKDRIRVFFTSRDNVKGQSKISYVDVHREDPSKILYVHDQPILEAGKIGTFDDCGTVGTYALDVDGVIFLYYNGYNVRNTVPWSNAIGLAVSRNGGGSFERMFEGPIIDRNRLEPYMAITPCVIRRGNQWQMWYTSGTGWEMVNDKPEPLYEIK